MAAALIAAKADLDAKDNVRGAKGGSGCGSGQERLRGLRVGSMPVGEVQRRLRARMMRTGRRERLQGEREEERERERERERDRLLCVSFFLCVR